MENQFWYRAVPGAGAKEAIHDALYSSWTEVDWLNEWKWYRAVQSHNSELTVLGAMAPYALDGSMPKLTF